MHIQVYLCMHIYCPPTHACAQVKKEIEDLKAEYSLVVDLFMLSYSYFDLRQHSCPGKRSMVAVLKQSCKWEVSPSDLHILMPSADYVNRVPDLNPPSIYM